MPRTRMFASLRELVKASEVELPGSTVGEVLDAGCERFGPDFARQLQHCRVLLNGAPARTDQVVSGDDELAILPPVAGGAAG